MIQLQSSPTLELAYEIARHRETLAQRAANASLEDRCAALADVDTLFEEAIKLLDDSTRLESIKEVLAQDRLAVHQIRTGYVADVPDRDQRLQRLIDDRLAMLLNSHFLLVLAEVALNEKPWLTRP